MLNSVDQNDLIVIKNLIDDAVVAAPRRAETLEFAHEWLPKPTGVLGDRSEDRSQRCLTHVVRKLVEMAQTLRGDLNRVHPVASSVVVESKPLALGRFAS